MSPFLLDDSVEDMDESSAYDHPGIQNFLYIFLMIIRIHFISAVYFQEQTI